MSCALGVPGSYCNCTVVIIMVFFIALIVQVGLDDCIAQASDAGVWDWY